MNRRVLVFVAAAALVVTGTATPQRASVACKSAVSVGVIPAWARGGFTDPKPRMPLEVGRSGRIAALVFGYPLVSPPRATAQNKILWVERRASSSPLRLHAQRMLGSASAGKPVIRTLSTGAGPSIIDMPAAGCWRFTLTWSGGSDTLDLQYERR